MAEPIIRMTWIRRQHLREHPDWLFVFGDNLAREGFGGQAAEMRGEPNAVGIPTKKRPSMHPGAFLTDADLATVKKVAAPSFERLRRHVNFGGSVVIPANGIGTEALGWFFCEFSFWKADHGMRLGLSYRLGCRLYGLHPAGSLRRGWFNRWLLRVTRARVVS